MDMLKNWKIPNSTDYVDPESTAREVKDRLPLFIFEFLLRFLKFKFRSCLRGFKYSFLPFVQLFRRKYCFISIFQFQSSLSRIHKLCQMGFESFCLRSKGRGEEVFFLSPSTMSIWINIMISIEMEIYFRFVCIFTRLSFTFASLYFSGYKVFSFFPLLAESCLP